MSELMVLGGERVAAADGKTFEVIEPATAASMADVAEGAPRTRGAPSTSRTAPSRRARGAAPRRGSAAVSSAPPPC